MIMLQKSLLPQRAQIPEYVKKDQLALNAGWSFKVLEVVLEILEIIRVQEDQQLAIFVNDAFFLQLLEDIGDRDAIDAQIFGDIIMRQFAFVDRMAVFVQGTELLDVLQ